MTLLLDNEDVLSVFSVSSCIDVIRQAYTALAQGRAVNVPRTDMMFPTADPNTFYMFKCVQGGLIDERVAGQRNQSDFDHFYTEGSLLKVANHRETYPSNVFLYSMDTLELLAIVHDGELQRMRVAATCAVAAERLARDDASVMGLYGAGFQAASMIQAMCAVRPIRQVKVYSPTTDRRIEFCKRMSDLQAIEVMPVDTPAEAARNADIVACATNVATQGAVCKGEWLETGVFATSIKFREFDEKAFGRANRIFQTALTKDLLHEYVLHTPPGVRVPERSGRAEGEDRSLYERYGDKLYPLEDLLNGELSGRTNRDEMIMFMKGVGTGIEFTATAKRAYDLAKAKGRGRELPSEWFMQTTHAAWRPSR
jgi:ornithine cyclodeaminase/alanine dehydrogenase-like protein (mu-crystallin family)